MGHRKRESRSAENIPQWVAILLLQHNLYAPASRSPLTPRPCAPYLTWFWWRHSQGGPHCEYVMCESGCIRLVGKWMAWLNRNTLYYFICSSTKTAYKRVRPVSIFPEILLNLILTCHWPATNIWYLQFSAATWWGKWKKKTKRRANMQLLRQGELTAGTNL